MSLFKSTFFSAIITLIRISSAFLANKVVAIYTGTGGIALLGAFSNLISIFLTFANGAINTGVVKYTAEYMGDEDKIKSLVSTSFKISLYCSGAVGFTLLFFGKFVSNLILTSTEYALPVRIFGLTVVLYSLNSLFISILNGRNEIKAYTIVNTFGSVFGLLLTLVLVYFFRLNGALYALVLSQSVVFFVTLFVIFRTPWFSMDYFTQKIDTSILQKLSHFTVMAVVTAVTVPVSHIVLRNMLISSFGLESAGIWQGLMRISDGYLMILTTALAVYYLPKLSSLHTAKELRAEVLFGYKLILPVVFFSALLIYILRTNIIEILYTADFLEMSDLFFYQLLGDFFKMASWILGYLIVAKSMTKLFILTEILSTLLYIVLGYVCVNYFGIKGITIAFAISYFLYLLGMIFIFRNLLVGKDL